MCTLSAAVRIGHQPPSNWLSVYLKVSGSVPSPAPHSFHLHTCSLFLKSGSSESSISHTATLLSNFCTQVVGRIMLQSTSARAAAKNEEEKAAQSTDSTDSFGSSSRLSREQRWHEVEAEASEDGSLTLQGYSKILSCLAALETAPSKVCFLCLISTESCSINTCFCLAAHTSPIDQCHCVLLFTRSAGWLPSLRPPCPSCSTGETLLRTHKQPKVTPLHPLKQHPLTQSPITQHPLIQSPLSQNHQHAHLLSISPSAASVASFLRACCLGWRCCRCSRLRRGWTLFLVGVSCTTCDPNFPCVDACS